MHVSVPLFINNYRHKQETQRIILKNALNNKYSKLHDHDNDMYKLKIVLFWAYIGKKLGNAIT